MIEQHYGESPEEGRKKAVSAHGGPGSIGGKHQPEAVQRLVFATDAGDGVDSAHQQGPSAIDGEKPISGPSNWSLSRKPAHASAPLVADDYSTDHRVGRGQHSAAAKCKLPVKPEQEGQQHGAEDNDHPHTRSQHQRRDQPKPAKLVYLQLYYIEEQYQEEGKGNDDLQDVIVDTAFADTDAPLSERVQGPGT